MTCNQDCFSLLPNALVITIISLLPLKDAVRTSVLARAWRNLWRLRTNIEINDRHFSSLYKTNNQHKKIDLEKEDLKKLQLKSCIDFGYTLFRSQPISSSISSFTLTFSSPQDHQFHINHFIQLAIQHHTKSLALDFSTSNRENDLPLDYYQFLDEDKFDLPEIVYNSESLESLKLVSCSVRGDNLGNLGNSLRTIFLGWIEFTNELQVENLVQNCPFLENLSFFECYYIEVYYIASQSLKTLVVDKCFFISDLIIHAPNLITFKYCGKLVDIPRRNFPHLQIVDFDFGSDGMIDLDDGDNIVSLLSVFHNARSLTVCTYTTMVLPFSTDELEFSNGPYIREITIKTSFCDYELLGIVLLLQSYPLLEKVCFQCCRHNFNKEQLSTFHYEDDTETLESTLVKHLAAKICFVEFKGFEGSLNDCRIYRLSTQYFNMYAKGGGGCS